MITLLIGSLVALSGYLALLLQSARAENAALRTAVSSLKRQLVKRRS